MALETIHNVEKGLSRLYCSPTDVDTLLRQGAAKPLAEAGSDHRQLFSEYLEGLSIVYPIAAEWWSGLIDAQARENSQERDSAVRMAFLRRVAGPASDPQFVALIREFWLRCVALNASLAEGDKVPPQVLLLGWLVEAERSDFVCLVTCMPYWPIGLDAKGNWC
ncbi:hypothetical protein NKH52_28710 [Mesorhizobium sp. M1066]|uniref:hypothetical protein n=1 Tax=unclassified Mesorhizobium TaxID=325217 RepID=UPI00333849D7